jgi:hypothetical protein
VLILVDSDTIGTFMSGQSAKTLSLDLLPCVTSQFVAVDGSRMVCTQKQWSAQGHIFTSTMGILPWGCFDMILG